MPRLEPRDKELLAESRRQQIASAALALWMENGFDVTTVDAIARRAGLAKGTVYLYFRTKEEILEEVLARHSLRPNLEGFLAALGERPIEQVLPLLIRGMYLAMRERTAVVQLLARELLVRPDRARQFIEKVVVPTARLLADHLEGRAARGAVRSLDLFVAMRALAGALMSFVITQELMGGNQVAPIETEQLVATFSDLFLHGLLPRGEA